VHKAGGLFYLVGMTENRPPEPRRPAPSSGRELASALRDVLDDGKARGDSPPGKAPPSRFGRSPLGWALVVVLGALSGYLWVGSPGVLNPSPPEPLPVALVDAGLRVTVFRYANQIEAFRAREGRLPESLAEVGGEEENLLYVRDGRGGFSLSVASAGVQVQYSSTVSPESFLGNARDVILEER